MSTDGRARAWVEVSAEGLRRNFLTIRHSAGEDVRILPMVKANAYGLGVKEVVSALEPLEPWGFGVATVEEGVALRRQGVKRPILVCSPTPPGSYGDGVRHDLILSISHSAGLSALADAAEAAGKTGSFHLEVDTGMGRAGFDAGAVAQWSLSLGEALERGLAWEGIFTHFHSADGSDPEPVDRQWQRLQDVLGFLPRGQSRELLVHACNSPGALRRPDLAANAVRPGIFLYGGVAGEELPAPAPVASLRARIVHIKEAASGDTVGYGATYQARGPERWATAAIGYGDGLPRLLGNRGSALVRGRRVPIIGRISMDVTTLDVTGVEGVDLGDTATFFGKDAGFPTSGDPGSEADPLHAPGAEGPIIALEEVAEHARTINYEILTGLTQRLPRIWMRDEGY